MHLNLLSARETRQAQKIERKKAIRESKKNVVYDGKLILDTRRKTSEYYQSAKGIIS